MATGIDLNNIKDFYTFNPRTILDVGAQVGEFASECKEVWPDADVFMVEGTTQCEKHLKKIGFPYAMTLLSDEIKEVKFYKQKDQATSTGNSIYRENTKYFNDNNVIIEDRTTNTLNNIFGDEGGFDMIKMDTQGSEVDIMRGGTKLIEKAVMIILEMSYVDYNIGAPKAQEVDNYMTEIGYQRGLKVGQSSQYFKNFDMQHYRPIQEDFVYINKKYIT